MTQSQPIFDVVLLTEDKYLSPRTLDWYTLQVLLEDQLVKSALEQQGLRVATKSWSDKTFDWQSTHTALFRTTWDYFDRFSEFTRWMDRATNATQLINEAALINWNMDKHYLLDLKDKGINTVETTIIPRNSHFSIIDWLNEHRGMEAIIKPTVSGAARHTYRVSKSNYSKNQTRLNELLKAEDMMVQPFQNNILEYGELSLIVINGVYTHAVRKIAAAGDFRVQDDHGGEVVHYHPSEDEIKFSEAVVAACNTTPLYARVDIIKNNAGQLAIMELELIEPELFFRFNKLAANQLAEAIAKTYF